MNETSKSKLEEVLESKIDSYTNSTNNEEKIFLLKEINSIRKILEENENHKQEADLKESRKQAEVQRIALEQDKLDHDREKFYHEQNIDAQNKANEQTKIELEVERNKREAKNEKRDFWIKVLGIAVPAVGALVQLGVGYLQYCGLVNMIYKESERPTPELKDTIKFTKNAIFRSK